MKKTTIIVPLLMAFIISYSGWSAVPVLKGEKYLNPISHQLSKEDSVHLNQMKLLTSMTAEKYGELRGRKLNLLQRLAFNFSKQRMKRVLNPFTNGDEPSILSKISWLLRGIVLGPIALLIGYLTLKDEDRQLIKWIWFGCIGFAIILVIALLA